MSQASFSTNTTRRVAHAGSIALLLGSTLMGGVAQAADVVLPTENGGPNTTSGTSAPTTSTTMPPSGNATVPTDTTIPLNGTRFSCQSNGGVPTVMYQPESQPNQAFPWAVPSAMGGGWSPEARCREIANRLESYRPDGLTEMATAVQNGYNTICVTTERVGGCRIVLTVPRGQDPTATRDRIFQNLASADDGQAIQGVNTLAGQSGNDLLGGLGNIFGLPGMGNATKPKNGNIDLRPFLSVPDGGTGTKMKGGVTIVAPVKPVVVAPVVVKPVEVKPAVTKKPVRRLFRRAK
ncbi:MAG: COP23 domain-containing protein [Alkalinema sp. CAN_BIN05]|nr:COP23 domain-containing protein [Alkalinema sp. CAN_BIN05]